MVEQIRLLEELAMNAWPPEHILHLDGWRLRQHRMPSRRVNSVWPNEWGGQTPLAMKLELAEAFYSRFGQPARYQVCPANLPTGLDAVLQARGYILDARTAVQTAPVETVLANSSSPTGGYSVHGWEEMADSWLDVYRLAENKGYEDAKKKRAALARIQLPTHYALVSLDGEPAAVGRGVYERGWAGVFSMATRPEFRRRGCGLRVIQALARWAQELGAHSVYLQVMENNPGAKALYNRAGFHTLYHYHYRQAPF